MSKAKQILRNNLLIEGLLDLMEKANKAIMEVYENPYSEVDIKDDDTPVTKADLAANKVLTDGLKKLFPEIPIVSEEDKSSLNIPKTNKVFWLIDPLDGTKEFIKKNDEFTCNLALIENNISTFGFVSIPVRELIYFGGKGYGSKVVNKKKNYSEIKCKSIPGICRVVASKSHLNDVTKKFIKSFDVFRNISKLSDEIANKIIRQDNLDILIDLMGYTPGSRMGILSSRAAPIQINYLAYPATTGSDQIDYILSDENVIPIDKQECFSEKVIYLPKTFICFNDSTQIAKNLREDPFQKLDPSFSVLLAFHRVEKINTQTLDCWIDVMQKYIDSYLWVKETNKLATYNLESYFKSKNIDLSRIVYAKRENLYADHLARYKKGDLLLDTFFYNGHTTTIEALWAGLPVITLEGNSFASRVSASILKSIGLDELIASSKKEYIEKVIFYLSNKSELNKLKLKLKNLKKDKKLFNTKEFVSNFETILKKLNTNSNY